MILYQESDDYNEAQVNYVFHIKQMTPFAYDAIMFFYLWNVGMRRLYCIKLWSNMAPNLSVTRQQQPMKQNELFAYEATRLSCLQEPDDSTLKARWLHFGNQMIIPACCTYHFRFAVIQRSSRLR
jgi:hypothetical protein